MAILGGIGLAGGIMSAMDQNRQQTNAANLQAQAYMQQAQYNAELYQQQAKMIQQQKKIADYQSRRRIASMRGDLTAMTAGKGLLFSGSPAAIMVDNESQLRYDAAIEKYNLDVRRNSYLSQASMALYTGQQNSAAALAQAPTKKGLFATILGQVGGMAGMFGGGGGAKAAPAQPNILTSSGWGYRHA